MIIELLALSSLSSSSAPPVVEPPAVETQVVSQGDRIWFNKGDVNSGCTVAYVTGNQAWTASHCVGTDTVAMDQDLLPIGEVTSRGNSNAYGGDWAVITLDADVATGNNSFSGDRLDSDVQVGDRIWRYGATTQFVESGIVLDVQAGLITTSMLGSAEGDSGGPVWSEDGFVGIHKGVAGYPGEDPTVGRVTAFP